MSMLAKLKEITKGHEVSHTMNLGGSGLLSTGAYRATVKSISEISSKSSGAKALEVEFNVGFKPKGADKFTTRKMRESFWIINKKGELSKYGYDSLCKLLTVLTGGEKTEVGQFEAVQGMVEKWDKTKESRPCLDISEYSKNKIRVGIIVGVKNGYDSKAKKATNEKRDYNEIVEYFTDDKDHSSEVISKKNTGQYDLWTDKFTEDYVKDTFKPVNGASTTEHTSGASSDDDDDL